MNLRGLIALGLPLLATLALVVAGVMSLRSQSASTTSLVDDYFNPLVKREVPKLMAVMAAQRELTAAAWAVEQAVVAEKRALSTEADEMGPIEKAHADAVARATGLLDGVTKTMTTAIGQGAEQAQEVAAISACRKALTDWSKESIQVLTKAKDAATHRFAIKSSDEGSAHKGHLVLAKAIENAVAAIGVVVGQVRTGVANSGQEADTQVIETDNQAQKAIKLFVVLGAAAALVTTILLLIYQRSSRRALAAAAQRQTLAERTTADLGQVLEAVSQRAGTLAASSHELDTTSGSLAASSSSTAEEATSSAAAAEQVSANVQTVATAAEEMVASIQEISHGATDAARIAQEAVEIAKRAGGLVQRLGESSRGIGQVVKTITAIAGQTNLLALNATIEAARAGDSGRGFAVVASEVKSLAQQTARATQDISAAIAAIQGDAGGAVEAMQSVGTIVERINNALVSIASAVEEQTATTAEITRNVSQAAQGAISIAAAAAAVAKSSSVGNEGIAQIRAAAAGLTQMSAELQEIVTKAKRN